MGSKAAMLYLVRDTAPPKLGRENKSKGHALRSTDRNERITARGHLNNCAVAFTEISDNEGNRAPAVRARIQRVLGLTAGEIETVVARVNAAPSQTRAKVFRDEMKRLAKNMHQREKRLEPPKPPAQVPGGLDY